MMITCSICGHLNDSSRTICEECGSDLSDSQDWGYDFDDSDDLQYFTKTLSLIMQQFMEKFNNKIERHLELSDNCRK